MDQALGLALEVFGLPAIAAGLMAAVVAWMGPRLLPPWFAAFALPAALALGFCGGYLCLPRSSAPLAPDQSWHWLPYVGLAGAAVGAVIAKSRSAVSISACCALALLVGGLLTPAWQILGLTRPASIVWLSLYVAGITIPLLLLPERQLGRLLVALMTISAAVLAVAIAAMISIRLAQLAGIAAAGLGGCYLSMLGSGKPNQAASRGLVPVFTTLVGGAAFVSCVEPDPPLPWLLVVPLVPLAIWLKR